MLSRKQITTATPPINHSRKKLKSRYKSHQVIGDISQWYYTPVYASDKQIVKEEAYIVFTLQKEGKRKKKYFLDYHISSLLVELITELKSYTK